MLVYVLYQFVLLYKQLMFMGGTLNPNISKIEILKAQVLIHGSVG
jgi:hypothetical protein